MRAFYLQMTYSFVCLYVFSRKRTLMLKLIILVIIYISFAVACFAI
jgi:hypothetical protein